MGRGTAISVGLMSMTLISLELVWTRIFSAEFFYTYAFLTLSLAIMGLGMGALALRLIPALGGERMTGLALSLCGLLALVGPPLVFRLGVDFSTLFGSWLVAVRFIAAFFVLSAAFFCGGVALATFFKRQHQRIPWLYRADLLGAAGGVLLAILLMNTIGTQVAVFWIAVPVLIAALLASKGLLKLLPVALVVAVVVLSGRADGLLESAREERAPVIYKHWDAMSKIKVYDYNGEARGINIDNVANTPVIGFDGDWEALAADTNDVHWDIDVGYLIDMFDDCVFLSLGAGGGSDVFQALEKGAAEIHAVEVNSHMVRMMLEGDPSGYTSTDSTVVDSTGRVVTMPAFSGHILEDPRVTVVAEDARTYVKRFRDKFDVIYSLSSNSWAALGSGSFALAENYIFTTEAFVDYWHALSDDGFLSMEHQVYMPRLVTQVLDALEIVGVDEPRQHIAVYNLPGLRRNLLLLSKRPLTDDLRNLAYGELTPEIFDTRHLLYPAADSLQGNLINRIVMNGWRAEMDSATVNLRPCTDDRPFIAQMGMWRNLSSDKLKKISKYSEFRGFPLSKIALTIILACVTLLVLPLNLLPYLRRGPKLQATAWLYFFTVGLAFMAVEIVLIQRYTLFIGASVYSIATVLLALLVASGIGSRYAGRIGDGRVFVGIVVLLIVEITLVPVLTGALAGLPMLARVLVSAVVVLPLGFFMGMPFPKGGLRVGERIDWGFSINGAASVLGATGVVMVAFTYGFTVALLVAAGLYACAYLLLRATPSD